MRRPESECSAEVDHADVEPNMVRSEGGAEDGALGCGAEYGALGSSRPADLSASGGLDESGSRGGLHSLGSGQLCSDTIV